MRNGKLSKKDKARLAKQLKENRERVLEPAIKLEKSLRDSLYSDYDGIIAELESDNPCYMSQTQARVNDIASRLKYALQGLYSHCDKLGVWHYAA